MGILKWLSEVIMLKLNNIFFALYLSYFVVILKWLSKVIMLEWLYWLIVMVLIVLCL